MSKTGAVLDGTVVSNTGGQVEYWVQYGQTTSYGSTSPVQTVATTQNAGVAVKVTLAGLQGSTLYHYRFCARDSEGGGCGADATVTTQPVGCGETVTTSVKLTGDLECPAGVGTLLTIGADGIELDLGGHSLVGAEAITTFVGIANHGGYDDVIIRDGTVTDVSRAVSLRDASRNRILRIKASSTEGVLVGGGAGNEIRHNDFSVGRDGAVRGLDTSGLVVADSVVRAFSRWGILVTGDGGRLVRNQVVNAPHLDQEQGGIEVAGSNIRIAHNLVGPAWIRGGIVVSGSNNVVVANEVFDTPSTGSDPGDVGSWYDGIFVKAGSTGIRVHDNITHDNHGDGIEVQATGVSLGDNVANDNFKFGIDAVAGVTDLGGNTASGNGNPLQCRGVFCP